MRPLCEARGETGALYVMFQHQALKHTTITRHFATYFGRFFILRTEAFFCFSRIRYTFITYLYKRIFSNKNVGRVESTRPTLLALQGFYSHSATSPCVVLTYFPVVLQGATEAAPGVPAPGGGGTAPTAAGGIGLELGCW